MVLYLSLYKWYEQPKRSKNGYEYKTTLQNLAPFNYFSVKVQDIK